MTNQFVWFRKWIMEHQVYKYLVSDSEMSQSGIQRLFRAYQKSPPKVLWAGELLSKALAFTGKPHCDITLVTVCTFQFFSIKNYSNRKCQPLLYDWH